MDETVTLTGGPYDDYRTVVDAEATETAIRGPHGTYPNGRSWYQRDDAGVWRWVRDTP